MTEFNYSHKWIIFNQICAKQESINGNKWKNTFTLYPQMEIVQTWIHQAAILMWWLTKRKLAIKTPKIGIFGVNW